MPFEMTFPIWALVRCCTRGLVAMFTALSLPWPSKPWQAAQLELKAPRPEGGLLSAVCLEGELCIACGNESCEMASIRTSPNFGRDLGTGCIRSGQHSNACKPENRDDRIQSAEMTHIVSGQRAVPFRASFAD